MKTTVPLLAFGLLSLTICAGADDHLDHDKVRQLRKHGQILPMEQLLEQAARLRPGQLIEAELEHRHGGYRYEIKILDADGRVHELELDAATARPLHHEIEP
ncbi:PepSY domain-containing protein [Marichromatium gracile]|uniref:PepSY domain-containing protein n=1 Tax=Marichromatium TaxID=85076 RepID=UPI000F3FB90F|nr:MULTISPECIES: PepSY domain-containing protein [Marichromatium]MBO8087108.1 PepSY domain-containing protein [Marichromatium sp.]MCF1182452.1 PepSY domain-containing protein [Marichromatium gracile]RNE91924.1 peptidase M4 [Marichromatium sp. AB31]RNE92322.1 peptidase M4 [Marichromatium sp. AB32]